VAPTCTKAVVSGYNIADSVLKIKVGGEFITPEFADVKTEEFSTTYLFKEAITPEALRLEFFANRVELYEIELF